jgi:hypothetical protein
MLSWFFLISSIWAPVMFFSPSSSSISARAIHSLRHVVWRFLSENRRAISGLAYLSASGF